MDGRIKEYYFNEINDLGGDFNDFFEDEMEAMYQPVMDKKAAKAAEKDLKEEFIEEEETVNSDNDDLV
jgi:hypothetical protein